MTREELDNATDAERLHWLGAVLAEAKLEEPYTIFGETFQRETSGHHAVLKAIADLEAVKGDARVPEAVKTAIEAIRAELTATRTRPSGGGIRR